MRFWKIQGTGNDFIIINNINMNFSENQLQEMGKRLCQRRVSIGADALIALNRPQQGGDFRMQFINSDGTIGEMCGNGARCMARYGFESGMAGEHMVIETLAGAVEAMRCSKREYKVKINNPSVMELENEVIFDDIVYQYSYLELGKPGLPHVVVEDKELDNKELDQIRTVAMKFRNYKGFSKGANINFYKVMDKDEVLVRTYERGVEDFTLACGTGSTSTAVVGFLLNKIKSSSIKVQAPGGTLTVEVESEEGRIQNLFLKGDTNIVAIGEISDEDLK